jgi:peroxiredoxin
MQEKNELTFAVLSDPGSQVAGALGVLAAPDDDAGRTHTETALTGVSGDGTNVLPMPTVAVVDPAGTIRWIDVHPDYTTRTAVADIIDAVAALGGGLKHG